MGAWIYRCPRVLRGILSYGYLGITFVKGGAYGCMWILRLSSIAILYHTETLTLRKNEIYEGIYEHLKSFDEDERYD